MDPPLSFVRKLQDSRRSPLVIMVPMVEEAYISSLLAWREEMDANLRRENDRLALAGLFWLQKGFNTFGSSRDCDIVLPKPAPRIIGAFEFDGNSVTLTLDL